MQNQPHKSEGPHSNPERTERDANHSPFTVEPAARSVAVGLGMAGGAIACALIGSTVGAGATLIGSAIGAVAGALMGNALAGTFESKTETDVVRTSAGEEYWRANYTGRPYYTLGETFEDYAPAYRAGYEVYHSTPEADRVYPMVERRLEASWDQIKGQSRLPWGTAKMAIRDSWDRVAHEIPAAPERGEE